MHLKADAMASLIWRTAQKRKVRKNKNRVANKRRSRQQSMKAVRKKQVKLRWGGRIC